MSKYRNKRVRADGYTFDSKAEYRRYQELRLLEQAGEIHDLAVHTRRKVWEGRDAKGKNLEIWYVDDFSYVENATLIQVVEDVKGVRTAVFNIKEKLFRVRYPNIDFRVVNA